MFLALTTLMKPLPAMSKSFSMLRSRPFRLNSHPDVVTSIGVVNRTSPVVQTPLPQRTFCVFCNASTPQVAVTA